MPVIGQHLAELFFQQVNSLLSCFGNQMTHGSPEAAYVENLLMPHGPGQGSIRTGTAMPGYTAEAGYLLPQAVSPTLSTPYYPFAWPLTGSSGPHVGSCGMPANSLEKVSLSQCCFYKCHLVASLESQRKCLVLSAQLQ